MLFFLRRVNAKLSLKCQRINSKEVPEENRRKKVDQNFTLAIFGVRLGYNKHRMIKLMLSCSNLNMWPIDELKQLAPTTRLWIILGVSITFVRSKLWSRADRKNTLDRFTPEQIDISIRCDEQTEKPSFRDTAQTVKIQGMLKITLPQHCMEYSEETVISNVDPLMQIRLDTAEIFPRAFLAKDLLALDEWASYSNTIRLLPEVLMTLV